MRILLEDWPNYQAYLSARTFCVTVTVVLHAFTNLLSHHSAKPYRDKLEHTSLFCPISLSTSLSLWHGQKTDRRQRESLGRKESLNQIMGWSEREENSWWILRVQGLVHWQKETYPAIRQMPNLSWHWPSSTYIFATRIGCQCRTTPTPLKRRITWKGYVR